MDLTIVVWAAGQGTRMKSDLPPDSDAMPVAPIEMGDGARTGAGSGGVRDVPLGSSAFAAPARARSMPGADEAGHIPPEVE